MLVERDITLFSCCEHHFVPIIGKAHVAYLPGEHVVGLSKLNRVVQYYARRPQVQERLTRQIAEELKQTLAHRQRGRADRSRPPVRDEPRRERHQQQHPHGRIRRRFGRDEALRHEFLRLIGK